jgi:hypothetical protein
VRAQSRTGYTKHVICLEGARIESVQNMPSRPSLSVIPGVHRLKFSMPVVTEPPHNPAGGEPGPLSVISLMKVRLCELSPPR